MMDFICFSWLYMIIGISLSVLVFYVFVFSYVGNEIGDWNIFLIVWVSCLGVNIFIVGFNQLIDIEIDCINKFYLLFVLGVYIVCIG